MITVNSREEFLKEVKKIVKCNRYAVEIGVLQGEFSKMILDTLVPASLTLIDPFTTSGNKYNDGLHTAYSNEKDYHDVLNKFIVERDVDIMRSFSFDAVSYFKDSYFDFVYIDASHLYEDVKRDLNDWFPKLKSGGILAGHDYIVNGDFGVIKAVNEFMKEHDLKIFLFNENGGDWAIKI